MTTIEVFADEICRVHRHGTKPTPASFHEAHDVSEMADPMFRRRLFQRVADILQHPQRSITVGYQDSSSGLVVIVIERLRPTT